MDASTPASLAALRDIHLPAPVPFWPPAPGWWALAALLLMGVFGARLLWGAHVRRRDGWNRAALTELAQLEAAFETERDAAVLAGALSSLLRRAALARFPGKGVAALHGDAWFGFLCQNGDDARSYSPAVARELTQAAYRGQSEADAKPDEWIAFARAWLKEAA